MTENFQFDNGPADEIGELADAVIAGRATEVERRRLDELVCDSEEAAWAYVRHMHDTIAIHRRTHEARLVALLGKCRGDDVTDQLADPAAGICSDFESPAGLPVSEQKDLGFPYVLHGHLAASARGSKKSGATKLARAAVRLAAGMAVAILAGLGGWRLYEAGFGHRPGVAGAAQRVAKVVRSVDAVWTQNGSAVSLDAGDWLMTGRYTLSAGLAQLVFPWGTEVTLEAPTEIEFTGEGSRHLYAGQLVAKVAPEDTGFVIETPTVKVIDLGTEFGLSAGPGGESEVHVFRGAVDARPRYLDKSATSCSILLSTGEATSFVNDANPVRQIAFNPRRFSKAWRVASRVAETRGALRFVHPPPASVVEGRVESNESIVLFLEAESAKLPEPVAVTLTQPGLHTSFVGRSVWLPAGLEVDSYLVHFDPVGSKIDQVPVSAQGAVTFDRPILGIMARGDQLAASDDVFAFPGTQYAPPTAYRNCVDENGDKYRMNRGTPYFVRGLSGLWGSFMRESPAPNDWLRLSADCRTLTISCSAGGQADQLRVLVAATDEAPPAPAAQPVRLPQPFRRRPFSVGELIQAEDFDLGGEGVAYFDTTPDSLANAYRTKEAVELYSYLFREGTSVSVCATSAGEWLAYTVEIPESGMYVVKARVASSHGGSLFRCEFGETAATASLSIPRTRIDHVSPHLYQTVESLPISLEAGRQTMRVVMEQNHEIGRVGDFDWFCIERAGEPSPHASGKTANFSGLQAPVEEAAESKRGITVGSNK